MAAFFSLDSTLGALYLGVVFSSIIYGVSCLQAYSYFTEHSSEDRGLFRAFIGTIVALDTLHAAIVIVVYYHYSVTEFDNFAGPLFSTWSLDCSVTVGEILNGSAQWFFAFRVYHLGSKRVFVPAMIVALSLAQFALSGIVYVIRLFQLSSVAQQSANTSFATAGIAVHLACDVLITTAMTYHLAVNKTSVRRTNKAINLLITYTMNTFLLTSICALITLVTLVTLPESFVYAALYFILVRSETCSLLCLLNSREYVRQTLNGQSEVITLPALVVQADGGHVSSPGESCVVPASGHGGCSVIGGGGGEEGEGRYGSKGHA